MPRPSLADWPVLRQLRGADRSGRGAAVTSRTQTFCAQPTAQCGQGR